MTRGRELSLPALERPPHKHLWDLLPMLHTHHHNVSTVEDSSTELATAPCARPPAASNLQNRHGRAGSRPGRRFRVLCSTPRSAFVGRRVGAIPFVKSTIKRKRKQKNGERAKEGDKFDDEVCTSTWLMEGVSSPASRISSKCLTLLHYSSRTTSNQIRFNATKGRTHLCVVGREVLKTGSLTNSTRQSCAACQPSCTPQVRATSRAAFPCPRGGYGSGTDPSNLQR